MNWIIVKSPSVSPRKAQAFLSLFLSGRLLPEPGEPLTFRARMPRKDGRGVFTIKHQRSDRYVSDTAD